jgi:hypothetical protein
MLDPFQIKHDLQDAAFFAKAFAQAPELVTKELKRATWEASLLLEREVKERAPVGIGGGGGLKGSISAREPRVGDGSVIGEVGTSLTHAVPVELGTKPHMPPIQPLIDWVEHKFGLHGDAAEKAAWGVAMKIKAKGTKGVHMFEEAFSANDNQVKKIFADARSRIADQIGSAA